MLEVVNLKISVDNIKSLVKKLGYKPEDGTSEVYLKKYSNHNNYIIRINFNDEKIEYRSEDIDEIDGIRWGDTTTSNFENSENFVVLECVNRLLEKGYAPKNISLEHKYPLGRDLKGKLDILVLDNEQSAFMMIECKTWGVEFAKEQKKMLKDGGQLFSYYVQDKGVKYLCLYASCFSNGKIDYKNDVIKIDEAWLELNNKKEIHDHWNKNASDNGIFEEWANTYDIEIKALVRSRLKQLTKDDSGRIFNQFAEILRHNVVSDKPNAFNKILNLFICKIYDENKNEDVEVEFQWRDNDNDEDLQNRLNDLYKKGMFEFLGIDVTDYSEDEISTKLRNIGNSDVLKDIQNMFLKLRLQKNSEFAFIEVYNDESFKSNARVVREVVELLQPYQFRYGHKQQFLGDFFELLLNTSIKQESGQFFTPVPITRFIISCLPIKEFIETKIEKCETQVLPSAIDYATGSGHFLTEYMDQVQKIIEGIDVSKAKPSARKNIEIWAKYDQFAWAKDYVYGIEADYRLVKTTKVSSFLNGDGEANIIRANGLDHFTKSNDFRGKLKEVSKENQQDNEQFDILIANPPYSVAAFKSTVKHGDESFELYNRLTDNSSEIECLFIERTKQLLKVGGWAGVILPSSILSNTGIYTATREMLLKNFYVKAITEFGSNTFMATGTNTVTLFLERRPNSDWHSISNAINLFFDRPKDVTVLGIEKAFSKYIKGVFEDINFEDYISLVQREPNEKIKSLELYNDYITWFNNLTEIKNLKDKKAFKELSLEEQQIKLDKIFFYKIFEKEKEKMLYFLLAYSQKTVIVKVGEKQAEKIFIGYEFSNRRGHEGIKMLPNGTKLYDEENLLNPEKANSYIYKAFLNEKISIDETMRKNIFSLDLVDMISFNNVEFEKGISVSSKKKLTFKSVHPLKKINEIVNILRGITYSKNHQTYQQTGNVILTADNISLDNKLDIIKKVYLQDDFITNPSARLIGGDIFICFSSGSRNHVGKVAYISQDTNYYAGGFMGILRGKSDEVLTKYVYLLLSSQHGRKIVKDISNGANIKNINDKFGQLNLPVPPLDIQQRIVLEIEEIEQTEGKCNVEIEKLKKRIDEIINNIYVTEVNFDSLHKCSLLNPTKAEIQNIDDSINVSFVEMASVSEQGYIRNKDIRKLKELKKKSYTFFRENDIIIAKITPCMENGKCAIATNLENGMGMGSSEFHVIRVDETRARTKYIFSILNREEIRHDAKLKMTGKSGHRRVPLSFYEDLQVPIPSLLEQERIITEIEALEAKIDNLKVKISTTEEKKKTVLTKYL